MGPDMTDVSFGPYRLKRQERQVEGPDGPVDLSARAFDLLFVLLDHAGEVVSKDAIFDAVWPGVTVEENTLQVHVSALRKVLDPSMIVTVHGRGYRYAGPMPVEQDAAAVASAEHRSRKPVIAVLPFENLSGDPEQQYFSDGITGDITDRLLRFRKFAVIGQYSASAFRGTAPDFVAIRDTLKADFAVTGSVRRAGERIRIALRLSNIEDGEAIWAERYDRPMTDIFALQDEISELVAATIASHLDVEINARSSGKPPASLTSYEHLLQGCWHYRKFLPDSNILARRCFEQAVALDPRNGEVLAWLGLTYCTASIYDFSVENASKALELSVEAVALDPQKAQTHTIHTIALLRNGDLAGALSASERGLVLNPGQPGMLANRALALTYDGRAAEARDLMAQALRLEPFPPPWYARFIGIIAFVEGRYEDALAGAAAQGERAWDIMYALSCWGHLGRVEQARATLARLSQQGREPDWLFGVSREPFRDPAVRDRLIAGLKLALNCG
jgi:TolB-like protein/Flp pilus assembly protein TadD